MKFIVDMNLSPRWIPKLISAGHEAVHWSTLGNSSATDEEIMASARALNAVVLTHDLDFSAILAASNENKPSVVQIRSDDVNPDSIGEKIISAIRLIESELAAGAIASIDPIRTRLRLLPIFP